MKNSKLGFPWIAENLEKVWKTTLSFCGMGGHPHIYRGLTESAPSEPS